MSFNESLAALATIVVGAVVAHVAKKRKRSRLKNRGLITHENKRSVRRNRDRT